MNRNKLDKLRRELDSMWGRPQKASALESLAKRLGRKRAKRGSEPNWKSDLPGVYPVSIPHHGRDVPAGTVGSILGSLEEDILAWEMILAANGHG